ncbi:hypothetical protein PAXINDRAFT_102699 [Paxillus involutus ATCC 200175]|uniref:C2 domain-containing protein n=1 Tax=Paxillus involutus ATCC 200175 TaxID=664439 RepID=A0A0C9TL44_PAXIN|nr:hypothetical protein PAXINDRAFT_102699 [Paxillus involutus ATCC 200175]
MRSLIGHESSTHRGIGTRDIGSCLGNLAFQAVNFTQLVEPRFKVLIKDISLHQPPKVGLHDHFYVEISLDGRMEKTSSISMRHMPWTEELTFDEAHDSAILILRVFVHRHVHEDTHIGTIKANLTSFMGGSNVLHPLSNSSVDHCGKISFSVEHMTEPQPLPEVALDPTVQGVDEDQPGVLTRSRVHIGDISLHHPPKIGWTDLNDHFYVEVDLHGQVQKTSPASMRHMPWTERMLFDGVHDADILTLKVFAHRNLHKDIHLGTIEGDLASFIGGSNVLRPLSNSNVDQGRTPQISFSIERTTEASQRPDLTRNQRTQSPRNEALGQLVGVPALASNPTICGLLSDAECLTPFVEKIKVFESLVVGFAEIHPYAKLAWGIFSVVVKIVAARMILNHNLKLLFEAMDDAYSFVSEANELRKIESNRKIISALSKHTAECAQFIEEIAKKTDLEATFLAPTIETKVQLFIVRFEGFKASLQQRACIQTAVMMHEMAAQMRMGSMRCTEDVDYHSVPSCDSLEPHLTEIVDDIIAWVNGNTGKRVYVLMGSESAGTTAIARRVSKNFDTQGQLGSSYFIQEPRHASNIFRTISRDIAERYPVFRHGLYEMVNTYQHSRTTHDVFTQFTNLILTPSLKMSTSTPTLVVIDALNNCGSETSRREILEMLANRSTELPDNFHILVTGRPETDIVRAFQQKEHVLTRTIPNSLVRSDPTISRSQTKDSRAADPGEPLPPPYVDALPSIPEFPGDKHYASHFYPHGDQPHRVPSSVTYTYSHHTWAPFNPEVSHEGMTFPDDPDAPLETQSGTTSRNPL